MSDRRVGRKTPVPLRVRIFIFLGAANAALVVALGAYGAHALNASEHLGLFQTAVQYHMFHALGLLAVGWVVAERPASVLPVWAGATMVLGIVLFCGSLYLSAVGGVHGLRVLTPIGGSAFIVAWSLLAIAALRR